MYPPPDVVRDGRGVFMDRGLVGWKIAVEKGGLVKLRFPEYPMFYSIFYNCKFTSMFSSLIVFSSVFL